MTAKEKLTALADAVREKTGETGLLTLDAMTTLISSLEAGGGGLPKGWAMGEFNTTEETSGGDFPIEHGLGAIPNYIVIWSTSPTLVANSWRMVMSVNMGMEFNEDENRYEPSYFNSYGIRDANTTLSTNGCSISDVDGEDCFWTPSHTRVMYSPAVTYKWIAIVEEALT